MISPAAFYDTRISITNSIHSAEKLALSEAEGVCRTAGG
jgi:hypothetical protein